MRCLVTGGAGFIGSHLCEALVEKGHTVTVLDNLSTGSLQNLPGKVDFIKGDANTIDLAAVFRTGFDYVFHLASVVGVKRSIDNEMQVLKDLEGTKNVVNLSVAAGVKKLLFASSSEVYEETFQSRREDSKLMPRLPYGYVKIAGERYVLDALNKGLDATVLRYFNVYGARQNKDFVVTKFIKAVMNDERPVVYGDGSQIRDFVYVKDNVRATLKALENTKGEIINVGTGRPTTILELAENIISILGKKFAPEFKKHPYVDVPLRVAEVSKMNRLLGPARTSLSDGLHKTIKSYR